MTTLSVAEAYASIKNIAFPVQLTSETITVGKIDEKATLTWAFPTGSYTVPYEAPVAPKVQQANRPGAVVSVSPVMLETVTITAGSVTSTA